MISLGSISWSVSLACVMPSGARSHTPFQINNAGVFLDCYSPTCDGLDSMWVTNYLAHYLLTQTLLPALKAASPSRIVNVSSEAAWVSTLDIDLLPPTPFFSKIGGFQQQSSSVLASSYVCCRLPSRQTLRHQQTVPGKRA